MTLHGSFRKIVAATGHPRSLVASVARDIHHVIDRFVHDDVTVIVSPMCFRRPGDPVYEAVVERFTDSDWREMFGLKVMEREDLARELGLDEDVVLANRIFLAFTYW
jgi:hypothetical protein